MSTRCSFVLLMILAYLPFAHAKGSTDLIVILGGGLSQPVEVTDSTSLKDFDPWNGQFADWQQQPLAEAPCFRRSFEVRFFMKAPNAKLSKDGSGMNMIYATRYCFTDSGGYVYFPHSGQPYYGENISTIMRPAADGKWYPATPGWDALMMNAVSANDPQRPPDMILIAGGELQQPIEVTDPELLKTFDPWGGLYVDWKQPAAVGHCSWEYEIFYFKRGIERPKTKYDRDDLKMIYGLRYCLDADGGPGYVHLAEQNDRFGPENMQTVWDGKQGGRWHPSTREWNRFITGEIADQVRTAKNTQQ